MKRVSTERLTEIASEVMDLIDAPDIFGFLDDNIGNMQAVETRLQEVMQGRHAFETIEIAMYLRTCNTRRDHLPTWQPLLNAAVALAFLRNESINDIFYGLMEPRPEPQRNCGVPK